MNTVVNRVFLIAVLLCTPICLLSSLGYSSPAADDMLCGPRSLLVICQQLGVKTTLDELTTLCGLSDDVTKATLLDLSRAASGKGLVATGMKISCEELLSLKQPAIVHLWGDHYVVAEAVGADEIKVTDPPNAPVSVSAEQFKERFSGFALLVSREPIHIPESGPRADLRLSQYVHDFGFVDEGNVVKFATTVTNRGDVDLQVSEIVPSCDCVVATLSPTTLPPGTSGRLDVAIDLSGRKGQQDYTIDIQSNDPVTPVVSLYCVGAATARKLTYTPASIDFGVVPKSSVVTRRIYMPDSSVTSPNCSADKLDVSKIESNRDYVTAKIVQAPSADEHTYIIEVQMDPQSNVGLVEGELILHTSHHIEKEISIPFRATIEGDVIASPAQLYFGTIKHGATKNAVITIESKAARPMSLSLGQSPDYVAVELTPTEGRLIYRVKVTIKDNAPAGNVSGEVVFHTGIPDRPEIKVPLYALVTD